MFLPEEEKEKGINDVRHGLQTVRKEDDRFRSCREPYFVMPASAKQIIPVSEGIRMKMTESSGFHVSVIRYRFPDREGGFFN